MATPADNNYAPPKSVVADVTPGGDAPTKASRGTRLGAAIVDGLIWSLPYVPAYVTAIPVLMRQFSRGIQPNAMDIYKSLAGAGPWFAFAGVISLGTLIVTAVLVHRNGQTIAKKWLKIKVVRTDGSRATLGRIFWLRNVVNALFRLIPFIGKLYMLVDALFIFGEPRRCCHDYIADTIVVEA